MAVNDRYNLISSILGMYIGLLPLLMAWHASHHSFENPPGEELQGTYVTTENDAHCDICTYYFDQQLYVQGAITHHFKAFSIALKERLTTSFHLDFLLQNYLRGPPTIQ